MSTATSNPRSRAAFFAGLALLVAAGTAFAAFQAVADYETRIAARHAPQGMETVVVAAVSLRPGATIGPDDIKLVERPATGNSEGLFDTLDTVIGTTVGDRILEGEPIRTERLLSGGAALGVDEILEAGTRAVTIRTNRAAGVGGLLQPGNYVDVIVTIKPDDRTLTADWVTETILQGVRVIAIGDALTPTNGARDDDKNKRPPREVFATLEVEPPEAEELALATSRGEIHLALRSQGDFSLEEDTEPLVTNALVGLPEKVATSTRRRLTRKAAAASAAHTTDVIRGSSITTEQFDDKGTRMGQPTQIRR